VGAGRSIRVPFAQRGNQTTYLPNPHCAYEACGRRRSRGAHHRKGRALGRRHKCVFFPSFSLFWFRATVKLALLPFVFILLLNYRFPFGCFRPLSIQRPSVQKGVYWRCGKDGCGSIRRILRAREKRSSIASKKARRRGSIYDGGILS
jgi:hypothetical protein